MRLLGLFYASSGLATLAAAAGPLGDLKPNFIVILTDDQDQQMDSLKYMKGVQANLIQEGTIFPHHYCTVSVCCPSRANMWTGKAAHNTNVTDLHPPFGGYPRFFQQDWHKKWLPTWLKRAGYQTYFGGKLMNAHNIRNYRNGLNEMSLDGYDFMLDPGTYQYWNTTIVHTGEAPRSHTGVYATDLLTERALEWIYNAAQEDAPFFAAINPVSPHGALDWATGKFTPPPPATRHEGLFPNIKVPRGRSYNPEVPSGASWVRDLPRLNPQQIRRGDNQYRHRLQALQSVDDMVNDIVALLTSLCIIDNTFIIYTSDNGFHIGQHRLPLGKRCPYEEDINVPMIIRGPGIPKGRTANFVTTHTDITPSIVHWAGASTDIELDGSPIPITGLTRRTRTRFEHAQMEFWGHGRDDLPIHRQAKLNGYKALRVIGRDYNLFYSVWCDGSHEIYDMINDPLQMENLYDTDRRLLGTSMKKLQHRLDALAMVLKTCSGQTCQEPWSALHPRNTVFTIAEAVHPHYDEFYASQPKVRFDRCLGGYFLENEQPTRHQFFDQQIFGQDTFGHLMQQELGGAERWAEYWLVAG